MDRQFFEGLIENGVGAFVVVLALVAVVSVLRSAVHQPAAKVLWAAFVLVIPVAGPVVWFFTGRETPQERETRKTAG